MSACLCRRREKQEFGAFPSARRLHFNDGGFQPPENLPINERTRNFRNLRPEDARFFQPGTFLYPALFPVFQLLQHEWGQVGGGVDERVDIVDVQDAFFLRDLPDEEA